MQTEEQQRGRLATGRPGRGAGSPARAPPGARDQCLHERPAGVGKSRRPTKRRWRPEGWATLAIRGSAGYAGMPLGPFRTVLGSPGPSDLAELTESVTSTRGDAVRLGTAAAGRRSGRRRGLAALLHQVVAAGLVVAVVTTRTGTPPGSNDRHLEGRPGGADRAAEPLSPRDDRAARKGLGGNVQDSSANRIWQVTAGNPLYLREVVLSSLETGALRRSTASGAGGASGRPAPGSKRSSRPGSAGLDPDELTAMEMLALAGPLPSRSSLARRPQRAVHGSKSAAWSRPSEAGAARGGHRAPAPRRGAARQACPRFGSALCAQPGGGAAGHRIAADADRVRLACWSLELGVEVDPMTLALGSGRRAFRIGQAISARLHEILPDADRRAPGGRSGGPARITNGRSAGPSRLRAERRPRRRRRAGQHAWPGRGPWSGRGGTR